MSKFSQDFLNEIMLEAVAEAQQWIGATSPNPPVGAIAVNEDGRIIAKSAHHRKGELHAEAKLIQEARQSGSLDSIHTLFVTLEPCNHHGSTPPCSEAIIASGIRNIVIGTLDPNPVATGGLQQLKDAGIEVTTGIAEDRCKQLIYSFVYNVRTGKAWITVKRAFTETGSMIPPEGQKVFSSESSLIYAHLLRKASDAIITGSGTVLADNPLFNVRYAPDHPNKRRKLAILDRRGRVKQNYLTEAKERGLDAAIYGDIQEAIAGLTKKHGETNWPAQHILVEAGPTLSEAVLNAKLWTMLVDIHVGAEGQKDRIKVRFNLDEPLPFNPKTFALENILPLNQPRAA